MSKLADLERIKRLWNKIKANFVKKNADGDVTVSGELVTNGKATFRNGAELREGKALDFTDENNVVRASLYASTDGSLRVTNGTAEATIASTGYVDTAVANAGHLKREKVSALPGLSTAKENVIYMVSNSTTGNNKFDEYMLIDGAWEKTGSSEVDLSGYSTTEQMNTAISTAVSNSYTLITDAEIDALPLT